MTVILNTWPAPLNLELREKLERVSFPTIGHYLEEGFGEPSLQRQVGAGRVVGRAVTVRTLATDSTLLHHIVGHIEPGDVLVVDTGGDRRHAPVGLVVAAAAAHAGAAGIVVDGVITDVEEVATLGIPIFAYGRSVLTTKLQGLDGGGVNVPVIAGGVRVEPGDVVLGDANGLFIASPTVVADIIDVALADDAEEPELIAAIRNGARLGDETGATSAAMALADSAH